MTPTASNKPRYRKRRLATVMFMLSGMSLHSTASLAMPHEAMKDHNAMTTPTTATSPSPKLDATQALQRMLELIRGIHAVTDVTPDYMRRVMGVNIESTDAERFGFNQALPGHWAFGVERSPLTPTQQPQVDLSFDPIPNSGAASVPTCEPNYASFTASLEGMGFQRHPAYGEHGRWKFDAFDKPGLHVEVLPVYDQPQGDQEVGTACVKMVIIR